MAQLSTLLCAYGQDMSRQKTVTTAEVEKKVCTFNSPKNVMGRPFINSYKYLLRTYCMSATVPGMCNLLVSKTHRNCMFP